MVSTAAFSLIVAAPIAAGLAILSGLPVWPAVPMLLVGLALQAWAEWGACRNAKSEAAR